MFVGQCAERDCHELPRIHGGRLEGYRRTGLARKQFTDAFAGTVPLATPIFSTAKRSASCWRDVMPPCATPMADRSADTALIVAQAQSTPRGTVVSGGAPVCCFRLVWSRDPGALISSIISQHRTSAILRSTRGQQIAAASVVAGVNYCALDTLQMQSRRAAVMETSRGNIGAGALDRSP